MSAFERTKRLGVSTQDIHHALKRLGVTYKKSLRHPKASEGKSIEETSPSVALTTQREPLNLLGSHYPTIGLTPFFQCGNIPGYILAMQPSRYSALLL
jgi:hypothetical protein